MSLDDLLEGGDCKVIDKTFLVMDVYNLLFRNLHVAYSNDPLDEEFNTWKYMMVSSIYFACRKFKPDQLIMAIDLGSSWRKDVYEDYKAQREGGRAESPIDFEKFFKVADEFLEGMEKTITTAYWLKKRSYEADDIIAVLAKKLAPLNTFINISTDHDFYQLYKHKGYKQYNPVKKQFAKVLDPAMELEVKLLTGDSSDNIPQIRPRMGPKTAAKWAFKLPALYKTLTIEEAKAADKQYMINKMLIDMEMIPQEMQDTILDLYDNYPHSKYKGRVAYDYFSKNGMPKVIAYIQEFNQIMSNLKSYEELK